MKAFTLRFVIPLFLLFGWSHCANIQSPTGGPKDKRPPKLVSSIPAANATDFHGTTILLTFDEAVKLNSPREEIIISPSPGKEVEYTVKGNKVFIKPKERLKDSTTYSVLFREGVQDITEGNVPPNLKLAFSTGPYVDSLTIAGQVYDVLEGLPKDKITVAIYSSDTFDIFSDLPSYFTKTDKRGNFTLENLRPGTYRIYAFNDVNKNLKVESRNEAFGFLQQDLHLQTHIDTLSIGLVQLDSRPLKISSIRNIGNITRVKFSKTLADYQLRPDSIITHAFGENTSEINLWNTDGNDSLKLQLTGIDSLNARKDTVFYIKHTTIKPVKEKFSWSLGEPVINPENARMVTRISFSKPLRSLQLDSLYVQLDSTERFPITREDLTFLKKKKEILVSKLLPKKLFAEDQNPLLKLIARPMLGLSMDGDTTKAFTNNISILWPEENGTIAIQVNTKKQDYILQLQNKGTRKVVLQTTNTSKLTARNLPPADYEIRVILDTNKNGVWDAGNYYQRIEPERIIYYRSTEGTRSIPVRANWEIGPLQFSF